LIITGASGFLGSRLVTGLARDFEIFAFDRRSQGEAGLDERAGLHWFQIDLAEPEPVRSSFNSICEGGPVDFVLHLAAYYDFTGHRHPEYERANVQATRVLLENCKDLGLKRFIFASSVAACGFSTPGDPITEGTPPLGSHIYAVTKRQGEEMLAEYASHFPSCVIRFAALFSDWCEYAPLYMFLETWLSRRWNSRILGGRGDSAIPYLHVRDAVTFVRIVLEKHAGLKEREILLASTDGAVSHRELYERANRYRFERVRRPLHVPRSLSKPGIWARDFAGRLLRNRPFERTWMADYIDRRMDVDATRTRVRLDWEPRPRRFVLARIPFMIEHMKFDPIEWYSRNRTALEYMHVRDHFLVFRLLDRHTREIEASYDALLAAADAQDPLGRYAQLSRAERDWSVRMALANLLQSIRAGEKARFMVYCRDLAIVRHRQGFSAEEVVHGLRSLEALCREAVTGGEDSRDLILALRDHLSMTIEFGVDQVMNTFEDLDEGSVRPE
jgi:nucleoside-diphosphate-sugar epimerase